MVQLTAGQNVRTQSPTDVRNQFETYNRAPTRELKIAHSSLMHPRLSMQAIIQNMSFEQYTHF